MCETKIRMTRWLYSKEAAIEAVSRSEKGDLIAVGIDRDVEAPATLPSMRRRIDLLDQQNEGASPGAACRGRAVFVGFCATAGSC
jgi:hypothetical protein